LTEPTVPAPVMPGKDCVHTPVISPRDDLESDPLRFLDSVRHRHEAVVPVTLWGETGHLLSRPDDIRRVLGSNRRNYHDPTGVSAGLPVHSPGIARGLRRALRREQIDGFASAIEAAVNAMLDRWEDHAGTGRPLDLAHEMVLLTITVLLRTLFAARLGDDEIRELAAALEGASAHTAPHRRGSAELAPVAQTVRGFVDRMIEDRRPGGEGGDDLLSALTFDRNDATGETLTAKQLSQTVTVFLVAGHQATASALAWTFHALAENQWAQARLGAEGPPYAKLALRESMRIYPPVWLLAPRRALSDDVIHGHPIPARSFVLISPWLLHRDPHLWSAPELFDPARFAGDTPPWAYLPFGAGPWGCLGSRFGMLEAELTLCAAAGRFRWESMPGRTVEPAPRAALWPRGGLQMLLHVHQC
jgi:cytochrome P450